MKEAFVNTLYTLKLCFIITDLASYSSQEFKNLANGKKTA